MAVDCSHVSVVMLGAFERLLEDKVQGSKHIGFGSGAADAGAAGKHRNISHEDLIRAGMRREVAGRTNKIVRLEPLSVEDYKAILMGPVLSGAEDAVQCRISLDAAAAGALAETAIKTNWACAGCAPCCSASLMTPCLIRRMRGTTGSLCRGASCAARCTAPGRQSPRAAAPARTAGRHDLPPPPPADMKKHGPESSGTMSSKPKGDTVKVPPFSSVKII